MSKDLRAEAKAMSRLVEAADRLSRVLGGVADCDVVEVKPRAPKPSGYELLVTVGDGHPVVTFIPNDSVDDVVDNILSASEQTKTVATDDDYDTAFRPGVAAE